MFNEQCIGISWLMRKRWWLIVVALSVLAGCAPEGYARIDPGGEYVYANPVWSPDSR